MIRTEHFPDETRFFCSTPADYMARSVRAGNTRAQCYVNDAARPTLAILHEQYTVLVDGEDTEAATLDAARFLRDAVLTPEVRRALGGVKILWGNERWRDCLAQAFAGTASYALPYAVYRHGGGQTHGAQSAEIHPITRHLLEDATIAGRDTVREEIIQMWGGVEPFLAHGFGTCAVVDGVLAGFCTAEYVSEGRCGIGIATVPEQRRKGYALAMTRAFLAECGRRGITPYWDCRADNEGSVRTAQRAGFDRVAGYTVLLLSF